MSIYTHTHIEWMKRAFEYNEYLINMQIILEKSLIVQKNFFSNFGSKKKSIMLLEWEEEEEKRERD